jgi:uncharacterized metal-binding protein
MANGSVHFRANVLCGLSTMALLNINNSTINIDNIQIHIDTIQVSIGLLLGTIITPDYDFDKIYIKKIIKKIPVLGFFWNLYWYPYSKLFKHRGLSHNLLLGTITRVLYLSLPILLFCLFTNTYKYNNTYMYILLGWYVQDFVHYILDSKLIKKLIPFLT